MKKAMTWLQQHQVSFTFHDYRKDGLDISLLKKFEIQLGYENMLNKRGTTWRQQPDEIKNNLNCELALKLMLEHPAMIKRPLLDLDGQFHLGFKADHYKELFL